MSGVHTLVGKRHRLATSTLVGAIGIFLPAAAAHAETTSPAPAGAETLAPVPTTTTASPGATDAQAAVIGAAATASAADDKSIRPFQFHAPDEALADLRRRIAATKWPERETVTDASQGVQLATMRELARYWQSDYDCARSKRG
jgi:hypothetical protein